MILFGICNISVVASYLNVHFLGSALTFMMAYVWGQRNEHVRMSFLGFITFNAPYLPWVMLTCSVLIGNYVTMDIIGICVGHAYYFLEYIYPIMADIRGWQPKRIMEPPALLHMLCGSYHYTAAPVAVVADAVPHDPNQGHLHDD
jgi:Derlin-2/3